MNKPSAGAMRAGERISRVISKNYDGPLEIARVIEEETRLGELVEAVEMYIDKYDMGQEIMGAALSKAKGKLECMCLSMSVYDNNCPLHGHILKTLSAGTAKELVEQAMIALGYIRMSAALGNNPDDLQEYIEGFDVIIHKAKGELEE